MSHKETELRELVEKLIEPLKESLFANDVGGIPICCDCYNDIPDFATEHEDGCLNANLGALLKRAKMAIQR